MVLAGLLHRTATAARHYWPRWRKFVIAAFFLTVIALLVRLAFTIDWVEVGKAFRSLSFEALLVASVLTLCSYCLYCSYDLLGRHLTGHSLKKRRVLLITFISYAFNLNFGSLVGGTAFRFRLYSRAGLNPGTIARVLATSILTNWIGYLLLAGVILATGIVSLPESWIGGGLLRLVGVVLVVLFLVYVGLVLFASRSEVRIRGHELPLPGRRLVWLQAGMSALNWVLMGGIVYSLLPGEAAAYPVVLGSLLLAAIAGVVTHVPAGLGVIEAVFLAVVGASVPQHQLLASLLAYRVVYYLVPLAFAAVLYAATEFSHRASGVAGQA